MEGSDLRSKRAVGAGAVLLSAATVAELGLIRLGQTYGSTPEERRMSIPGDDIVPDPQVVTNHAITINAPPEAVWPWLVQMGWHGPLVHGSLGRQAVSRRTGPVRTGSSQGCRRSISATSSQMERLKPSAASSLSASSRRGH